MLTDAEMTMRSTSDLVGIWIASLMSRDWEEPDPSKYIEFRKRLTHEIVRRGVEAVAALCQALIHSDWAVRDGSVKMLGEINSATAVPALVALFEHEALRSIQRRAADVLLKIEDAKGVAAAEQWLLQDTASRQELTMSKLADYIESGKAAQALMLRLNQLAAQKGMTRQEIALEYMLGTTMRQQNLANNLSGIWGIDRLSEEDRVFLESA